MASAMANDSERRKVFSDLLGQIISDLTPCIIIGRDTWRYGFDKDKRLLIEADFETRLRRRFLWEAVNEQKLSNLKELSGRILIADDRDQAKLPPSSMVEIIRVNNGQRLFSATLNQIMHEIGEDR
jgi:cytidylate kinase